MNTSLKNKIVQAVKDDIAGFFVEGAVGVVLTDWETSDIDPNYASANVKWKSGYTGRGDPEAWIVPGEVEVIEDFVEPVLRRDDPRFDVYLVMTDHGEIDLGELDYQRLALAAHLEATGHGESTNSELWGVVNLLDSISDFYHTDEENDNEEIE